MEDPRFSQRIKGFRRSLESFKLSLLMPKKKTKRFRKVDTAFILRRQKEDGHKVAGYQIKVFRELGHSCIGLKE